MTLSKLVGDLQRLGIKRSRLESPGTVFFLPIFGKVMEKVTESRRFFFDTVGFPLLAMLNPDRAMVIPRCWVGHLSKL